MVLFKRKSVVFEAPPQLPPDFDLDSEVWYIKETGEWFLTYEDYLDRLQYYNIQKFGCEVTGITNFTFFQAYEVERSELEAVEKFFPEPVREPILRYVAFSEVPRLDVLVDEVYAKFKNDFFPGDTVLVKLPGGDRAKGIVREKARFNSITLPNGEHRDAYCSYRVLFENDVEVTCNESNLSRHRNAFTKWYLRTFLKMSLRRLPRAGAPWVVKDEFAKKYRIPTEYPDHLRIFEVMDRQMHSKKMVLSRPRQNTKVGAKPKAFKLLEPHIFDNMKETPPLSSTIQDEGRSLKEWKDGWYEVLKHCTMYFDDAGEEKIDPAVKNKIYHLFQYAGVKVVEEFDPEVVNFIVSARPYSSRHMYKPSDLFYYVSRSHIKVWHYEKTTRFFKNLNITVRKIQQAGKYTGTDQEEKDKVVKETKPKKGNFINILPASIQVKNDDGTISTEVVQPATTNGNAAGGKSANSRNRVIMEDLLLPFQVSNLKPNLIKFKETENVSDLLEIWVFANIFAKAFLIDTFTFDDFLEALSWTDYEEQCPLLNELFSALLTALSDESGQLLTTLPREPEKIEDEKEEEKADDKDDEKEDVKEDETKEEEVSIIQLDSDDEVVKKNKTSKKSGKSNGNLIIVDDEKSADDENDSADDADAELSENESGPEEDDIEHNAYSMLEYKKVSWKTRLAKRQFKEGGYQIIIMGILSLVEHVPEYKPKVLKIYEALAPGDYSPTPISVMENFYTSLTIDMRIDVLYILMNLLLNGSVVRSYVDKCLDDSTILRRERLEILKDFKNLVEEAQNIHKLIIEMLGNIDTSELEERLKAEEEPPVKEDGQQQTENQEQKAKTSSKRRGGRPTQNSLPDEPSPLEKAVAQSDPEFLKLLKKRTDLITEIEELKRKRKEHERRLNEIDCQRVKYIGRDRLYNRYWWFENNGLPNLNNSNGARNEDDENNEDEEAEEDESDSEFVEDTYFMGRLWVQGPSDEDRKRYLEFDDESLNSWNKIVAEESEVVDSVSEDKFETVDSTIKEHNSKSSTPVVSDITEIKSEPLDDEQSHYVKRQYSKSFVKASNDLYGLKFNEDSIVDASGLTVVDQFGAAIQRDYKPMERKLIEEGSSVLLTSSDWSFIEDPKDFDKLFNWLNQSGERERILRKEFSLLQDSIRNSLASRKKALGIGKKSTKEIELEKEIESIVISETEESEVEEDDEEDDLSSTDSSELENKPRTRRTIAVDSEKKRQREEEIERRALKRAKRATKPAERIAKRQAKKRKAQEHEEKRERIERLKSSLENFKNNQGKANVLAWVNSSAIDTLGHSHFVGPRLPVSRKAASRKRSRR